MADFYTARINLLYAPANDVAQPWELTTPGQYLTGEPTREWNTEPTTYSLRKPRMYAQYTEHGIRRLYHVPKGYNGSKEEYAAEHEFKILVETPMPEVGTWAPVWHEWEDCIELEWVEVDSPAGGDS